MRFFSKNRALSLLSPYGPLTTCTISKKSLERILKKSVTYWLTYWLRKREISHVRCWEALHHQADQKTTFDLEWPGCTSFADVTFSTTCCNPISQRIPTPNVLYWPDLGDEETAQHLLVTQEPGKKVSCVISESQPQETTRPREEKMTTDFVKGKLVTFDAEKCFITKLIRKLHLTWSGWGVHRLPT